MSAYKTYKIDGSTVLVHRYVWIQAHGPIPDGHVVHHRNHQKHDNRLENLQLMTYAEHADHHNRLHPTQRECAACHEFYEPPVNHRARSRTCSRECFRALMAAHQRANSKQRKLPKDAEGVIRARVAAGERRCDLAVEYGVSRSTMTRVTKT